MQNKGLLFWILGSDKKPLYVNKAGNVEVGTGVLKTDGSPAHLTVSPEGWSDTLVKWGRNNRYLGLFREFSVPLTFIKDGGNILGKAMWRFGMETILYLAISKLDRTNFPDKYDSWYTGEFDFSKFKQTSTGVDIMLVEGGLSKLLKANEGTDYELPISTDPGKFSVYEDGLTFKNEVTWEIYDDQKIGYVPTGFLIGAGTISQEGTTQGVMVQDSPFSVSTNITDNWISSVNNKDIIQNYTVSVIITDIYVTIVHVFLQKVSLLGVTTDYDIVNGGYQTGAFISKVASFAIPMSNGDKVYIRAGGTGVAGQYIIKSGTIDLNYLVRFAPSLCECISWMRLFELLTEKLTGGKYGCRSNFLASLTDQCVTSGQAIRKEYQAGDKTQVIKSNFNDFFKSCQRWGVGLGIENDQLIIEPHAYFFGSKVAIALGEVKEVEWTVAEDLVFNTVKVGYTNNTYDKVNGLDEFNVSQQYTTPHTRIVKELDLICPYRADMFGIELTRLELYKKDTTDASTDNDTFIMNVSKGTDYDLYRGLFATTTGPGGYNYITIPSVILAPAPGITITFAGSSYTVLFTSFSAVQGETWVAVQQAVTVASYNTNISTYDANVYKLNRPAYSALTGLLNPNEAFNIELSPKRALLNNGAYIHSILDLQESAKVVFQTGDKNSLLSTTLAGVTVTENSNTDIFRLPAKLFRPYYAKFKTMVKVDLPAIMKATPYDKISFIQGGVTYYGYLWAGGIAPETNDVQEWTLLSAPENDLTKLNPGS